MGYYLTVSDDVEPGRAKTATSGTNSDDSSIGVLTMAIAYLGFMGGVSDIESLKKHVAGAEVRLRVPAQAALKRLAAAGMKAGDTR